MECPPGSDNSFGPRYCNQFDFTLLFEQSFFQIAPCALLLISIPWRASQLRRQNVQTKPTGMRIMKQTAIGTLAATQLALLIVWSVTPMFRTKASIPAALLSFLASLALLYLSSIEHTRSIRPSSTINVYILFSLLFDVPQARTLWLRPDCPRSIAGVFTAGLAAKTLILYLEARRKSLLSPHRIYAPEAVVNLYDRTLLWWMNGLFLQGYRGIISFENLYPIDSGLGSTQIETKFLKIWEKRSKPDGKRPLLWTIVTTLRSTILSLILPRLCLSALRLSQPLLINRITSWLSNPDSDADDGHGLIGATILIYLGLALSNVMFKRGLDRLMTQVRGILIAAVHLKSLTLPADKTADAGTLSLISNDTNRITMSLTFIDQAFAAPLEIAVAVYLLEAQISVVCIAPVLFAIVTAGISFMNSNSAIPMQKKWLSCVQERVAYTAAVLGCPKGFKMLGLTEYLSDKIQALRVQELHEYAEFRKYVTWRNVQGGIPYMFGPILTLAVFTLTKGSDALNPSVAFTTLSLVALVNQPIEELIHAVPMYLTAIASIDRIQAFLLLEGSELGASEWITSIEDPETDLSDDIQLTTISRPERKVSSTQPVVQLTGVKVQLGAEKKLALSNVSLDIYPGTLTFVVGPVGSGKSTLLRTIVGDTLLSEGHRILHNQEQDFGYCSQDTWLPNGTVKHIILGESKHDSTWYSTVVEACALKADLEGFPSGDDTVIGTKGVSLSGGQRQRISLARALYARKNILVLDDVLSGLDAKSSKHIVDNVLGPNGLCKKQGYTVVMATHAVRHLHRADHILALGETGHVVEQGTFAKLNSSNGYIRSLQLHGFTDQEDEKNQETALVKESVVARKPDDDAQQELSRRTGDASVYAYYAKSIGWTYGLIVLFSEFGAAFCQKFPDLWVRWWSEGGQINGVHLPLGVWIGVYFLLGVVGIVCVFVCIWAMLVWTVPKSSAKLHQQLLHSVMNAPYSFFVKTDSGVTLNRFSNDMSLIEQQLTGAVLQFMSGSFEVAGSGMLIAAGATYVGASIPFILFILYLLQKFYLRTSRQLRFMDLEAQAPLLTHCQETISGVTTIRAFGWQHQSHTTCLKMLDRSQRPYYLMLCIQRWLNLVLDLTTAGIATLVVVMATSINGTASSAGIGVSLFNILSFNNRLSYLIVAWTTLETSLGAIARCKNFEESTPSENLPGENQEPPANWPAKGAFTLKNVTASYTPDGPPVLHNISLSIPAGAKVGICGRSGSGKSSFLLTILRLIDPSSGTMELDGIDLTTLPRSTVRQRLTALPQEALAVPGSVQTNLDPLEASSAKEIELALQRVGLFDLIAGRGGIEAEMSTLGLSVGELQLFAVARALLHKSSVLIVDEMTSAVDHETEERLLDVIRAEFADSTTIAVAHRLKTIVDFDMVVVLDKGRIAEVGNPKELLSVENGVFRAMWERDS